jgi:hypothetical protein
MGKVKMETQDEDGVVVEEISRGLGDVEMQEDEDEKVAEPPPKNSPRRKNLGRSEPCLKSLVSTHRPLCETINLTPSSIS